MIGGLKPYPAYKNSGLPWLGKIPARWDVRRMKLLLREVDSRSSTGKEHVRNVAFEIALLGRNGLDYASPDEKYELRALPDRKFSGLHLMCLMYAGFKRVAPEHEVQMDLNDPFLTALQMHKNGEGKH
jgi:hypothetical protein